MLKGGAENKVEDTELQSFAAWEIEGEYLAVWIDAYGGHLTKKDINKRLFTVTIFVLFTTAARAEVISAYGIFLYDGSNAWHRAVYSE